MNNNKKILLAGAAPDTGNLGVSALFYSTITGIHERLPDEQLVALDHGAGIRELQMTAQDDTQFCINLCGAKYGKRYYLNEHLTNIYISCKLGGGINPIAKQILKSAVILDISGGDSFTDLYGERVFKVVAYPKVIAIENKIPLILLPQTYGPYLSADSRKQAEKIVKGSFLAWARDVESFEELKSLLGNYFDESRHFSGVDVAFLLPNFPPKNSLSNTLQNWLTERNKTVAGINISGLIYNQPDKAYSQYGFKADYQQAVYQFIKKLLNESDANIVLIPHVLVNENHYESDMAACKKVLSLFQDSDKRRIEIISDHYNQCEIKWVISQLDWFCGTRMHATIAGLSTGVATAAIAYSLKTRGVFKTCGQELQVIDPRELETQAVVDGLWQCWLQRDKVKFDLQQKLPQVLATAKQQMDTICANIANIQA